MNSSLLTCDVLVSAPSAIALLNITNGMDFPESPGQTSLSSEK